MRFLCYNPHILNAEVVEWYTRATQNRLPHGLRVRVPPSAQFIALARNFDEVKTSKSSF